MSLPSDIPEYGETNEYLAQITNCETRRYTIFSILHHILPLRDPRTLFSATPVSIFFRGGAHFYIRIKQQVKSVF
jgi:hypothetical protein